MKKEYVSKIKEANKNINLKEKRMKNTRNEKHKKSFFKFIPNKNKNK